MSSDPIDPLCEGCGEVFSDFLQEMEEKNAKVATCPKCGKIHEFAKMKPGATATKAQSPKKVRNSR